MKRLELRLFGDVQGVGFRSFAKRRADSFFLKGFVHNLPDGSIEIIAEGEEKNLQEFLNSISKGPMFSEVNTIEIKWTQAEGKFLRFDVR